DVQLEKIRDALGQPRGRLGRHVGIGGGLASSVLDASSARPPATSRDTPSMSIRGCPKNSVRSIMTPTEATLRPISSQRTHSDPAKFMAFIMVSSMRSDSYVVRLTL
ncbi:MAG: hypothetical protein ACI9MR_005070, partial [Myxococcota bacterium]